MSTATVTQIAPGEGRCVLVITAHADDATLFLGGTIARWADADWRVVVVRVTDDRWDSVGVDEVTTIAVNTTQFNTAMTILGVTEIVELGYPTDTLGDASELQLRERFVRLIRNHKPYALVTFDPFGMFHEDNQDHIKTAAAVDEAFWTAQFDKHHPEHLADGLEVHGAFERWYFARRIVEVTDVVDIAQTLSRKIAAAACHDLMLRNFVNQLRLQARTGGWRIPMLDSAQDGDLHDLVAMLLTRSSQSIGKHYGIIAAEEFRVVRFGGLEPFLENFGERVNPKQ